MGYPGQDHRHGAKTFSKKRWTQTFFRKNEGGEDLSPELENPRFYFSKKINF